MKYETFVKKETPLCPRDVIQEIVSINKIAAAQSKTRLDTKIAVATPEKVTTDSERVV